MNKNNIVANYEKRIRDGSSRSDLVKEFSEILAKAESEYGFKPRNILINGIVSPDRIEAEYDIESDRIQDIIDLIRSGDGISPDILIKGISIDPSTQIRVGLLQGSNRSGL